MRTRARRSLSQRRPLASADRPVATSNASVSLAPPSYGLDFVDRAKDAAAPAGAAALGFPGAVVQRISNGSGDGGAPRDVQRVAASGVRGGGRRLPHLERIQRLFGGHDLSGVQAFTGQRASSAALSIGARAYTLGERIAFTSPTPSISDTAHEAAHVVQQRAGVSLRGGVGSRGDRYEHQADAIGSAVARGESVEPQLGPVCGQRANPMHAGVQRLDVDEDTKLAIRGRIDARGGRAVSTPVEDTFYTKEKGTAEVAVGVASMADDVKFEAAAWLFENRLGAIAYRHPRARAVCQAASNKVLSYIRFKYEGAKERLDKINAELESFGMNNAVWSGAVGKVAESIRKVLQSGSINEQIAHVESFVTNVLNNDLMENVIDWETFAQKSGLDLGQLRRANEKVEWTGDKYLAYDLPEGTAGARQWHARAKVEDILKKPGVDKMPEHPSSHKTQPSVDPSKTSITTRTKRQIEMPAPFGLGVKLGDTESAYQQQRTGSPDAINWEEGARVYALNELDTWVFAQRQLSLPLVAGPSGTTARIMQAFRFLNIGPPDDVRLAAIGAMLPPRHHTLVEVMFGAKPYGASPYREGAGMYRDVRPLTDMEVRNECDLYPDEVVDPKRSGGGRSKVHKKLTIPPRVPQAALPSQQATVPASTALSSTGPSLPSLLATPSPAPPPTSTGALLAPQEPPSASSSPVGVLPAPRRLPRESRKERTLRELIARTRPELAVHGASFPHSRESLRDNQGISTFLVNRNTAQGRMLKAIDQYQAAAAERDEMRALLALTRVRKEAAHWMTKHTGTSQAHRTKKAKFIAIRDAAQAVIEDAQKRYLLDLAEDKMLADSQHAFQGQDQYERASGDSQHKSEGQKLIQQYGLTAAECAAIAAYVGPSYKFINTGLDENTDIMTQRLQGFVRETGNALHGPDESNSAVKNRAALAKARGKLRGTAKSSRHQRAINESKRHATLATIGLQKLPPYNGTVFAGGALPRKEAEERFQTGEVQERAAFSSTTRDESVARSFTATKWYDVDEDYQADSVPKPDKEPFAYMLKFQNKTGRNIEKFSHKPEEKEVLLPPFSKLRITLGADRARPQAGHMGLRYILATEV